MKPFFKHVHKAEMVGGGAVGGRQVWKVGECGGVKAQMHYRQTTDHCHQS